jgi:hypothetical protein
MDLETLHAEVELLAAGHEVFDELARRNGPPPLWRREPDFETVTRLILEP